VKIIRTVTQMQSYSDALRRRGKKIGLVPTMGYLHEGHLSLVRRARRENDAVILSIFVNPAQFGPKEDFRKYPRNFKRDEAQARRAGVDVIFYPSAKQIYPQGFLTYVGVEEFADFLCGTFRPGHFQGVTTVCAKLFNAAKPHTAYFGQKDAQQAIILKKMVKDLDFGFKIKVLPIIREPDGLAMSSRNKYLSRSQRNHALCLYQALNKARDMIKTGCLDAGLIRRRMLDVIKRSANNAKIDYVSLVDTNTLKDIKRIKGKTLIALAVKFGKTRLIDNMVLDGTGRQKEL